MSSDPNRKYKKPKKKTHATTNPESSSSRSVRPNSECSPLEHVCPLLAKDSEWVDILQNDPGPLSTDVADEEEVLQLVDCEDGSQMKPLAIMFPGLLDKDPQTLHGMLNRAMSTTEVTRQLVDLGQKANFTFMKKADRLIPPDKKWLESLPENSDSISSLGSAGPLAGCASSSYEASEETSRDEPKERKKRKKQSILSKWNSNPNASNDNSDDEQYGNNNNSHAII